MDLEALREKKEKIKQQNEILKKLNYKLEALLVSLDTYSISKSFNDTQNEFSNIKSKNNNFKDVNKNEYYKIDSIKTEFNNLNKAMSNNFIKKEFYDFNIKNSNKATTDKTITNNLNTLNKTNNDNLQSIKSDISFLDQDTSFNTYQNTSLLMDTKNIFLNRISSDTNLKKSNKGYILKIVDLLYENKNGLPWEEIIQKSGVPKYKCIEILNNMIKSNPPVLIKKRDKGFTCYLNM